MDLTLQRPRLAAVGMIQDDVVDLLPSRSMEPLPVSDPHHADARLEAAGGGPQDVVVATRGLFVLPLQAAPDRPSEMGLDPRDLSVLQPDVNRLRLIVSTSEAQDAGEIEGQSGILRGKSDRPSQIDPRPIQLTIPRLEEGQTPKCVNGCGVPADGFRVQIPRPGMLTAIERRIGLVQKLIDCAIVRPSCFRRRDMLCVRAQAFRYTTKCDESRDCKEEERPETRHSDRVDRGHPHVLATTGRVRKSRLSGTRDRPPTGQPPHLLDRRNFIQQSPHD